MTRNNSPGLNTDTGQGKLSLFLLLVVMLLITGVIAGYFYRRFKLSAGLKDYFKCKKCKRKYRTEYETEKSLCGYCKIKEKN